MKKILIPVDFSQASHDAYLYARGISERLNATLEVIHVYTGTFSPNEPLVLEPMKGREEVIMDRLNAFCNNIPEEGDIAVKVDYKAISALSVPNKIIKLSKEVDLIVMGASGEHDVIERFLGSVSSKVAQKAQCPVLLIPKGFKYQSPEKIVYASNWESVKPPFLKQAIEFGANFGSKIDFVHISNSSELDDFEELGTDIFNSLFKEGAPDFAFNYLEANEKSPIIGLNQYAGDNEADLIVLVNRQDGWIENILGQSVTKEMAIQAKFPMLIFHL